MSTRAALTDTVPAERGTRATLRRAQAMLYVGAAAALGLAAIGLFVTTSSDNGPFHYIGDYLLTGDGALYMLVLLALLPALRTLQGRRGGGFGLAGLTIASVGAGVLLAMFVYGLIAATGGSFGPTYVLASLATVLGVALLAAGSWRAGLVPGWLAVLWAAAWTLGGPLPFPGPGPVLLAAAYVLLAVTLQRRVGLV